MQNAEPYGILNCAKTRLGLVVNRNFTKLRQHYVRSFDICWDTRKATVRIKSCIVVTIYSISWPLSLSCIPSAVHMGYTLHFSFWWYLHHPLRYSKKSHTLYVNREARRAYIMGRKRHYLRECTLFTLKSLSARKQYVDMIVHEFTEVKLAFDSPSPYIGSSILHGTFSWAVSMSLMLK